MHAVALRYLQEVAHCGSIRKAAQALNVASSAVNRQVLKLERDLGTKLFDRMTGGVQLTPAGEILLRHVRDTLQSYDRAVAGMDGLRGLRSGHVRIATLDSLMLHVLPDVLGGFATRYPAVTLSVAAEAPAEVLRQVQAGEADIGLTFAAATGTALSEVASIAAPIGAVMSAQHPLAGRAVLGFDELLSHPAVVQQSTLPPSVSAGPGYAEFRGRIKPRFVSNDIGFVKRMLLRGLGVGFYTRLAFQEEIGTGALVWVPLDSPGLAALRVGLFVPTHRTLTPACHALVNAIAQEFNDGHAVRAAAPALATPASARRAAP